MFQKQIRMDFSSYDIELELAVPMKHARLLSNWLFLCNMQGFCLYYEIHVLI